MKTEGSYFDKIDLKTDSPENPDITIHVYGRIKGESP